MSALNKLKDDGKIRHYGVSNFTPEMMAECERHGHLAANQVGYHMFDRRMESAVLPFCGENNIGFMAYGTLGFGLLSGAFTPETTFGEGDWRSGGKAFELPLFQPDEFAGELRVVERLKTIAAEHDKSVAQLAIAWTTGHPAVSVGLVGVRNERELKENVAAADWKLGRGDAAPASTPRSRRKALPRTSTLRRPCEGTGVVSSVASLSRIRSCVILTKRSSDVRRIA